LLLLLSANVSYQSAVPSACAAPVRPAQTEGTVVIPANFLHSWDPITVFFDHDAGPEQAGPEDDPGQLISIWPEQPGALSWIDARTLQFRPAIPWPPLSEIAVTVDGQSLTLNTLLSAPTRSYPADKSEGLNEVRDITIDFAAPVDPAALARAISLEYCELPGTGEPRSVVIPGEDIEVKMVERESSTAPARYVLTPRTPVPLGVRAQLIVRLSLDSTAKAETRITFSTARPFRVLSAGTVTKQYPITPEGVRYGRDDALAGGSDHLAVIIDFTTEPQALDVILVKNLVRFTPRVENLNFSIERTRLRISGRFQPGAVYQVNVLPAAISDVHGRPLEMAAGSEFFVYFASKPAYLKWKVSQGIVERFGPRMVPAQGRGDEQLDLRIYAIDPWDPAFWPFPRQPLSIDEDLAPPWPGETTRAHVASYGYGGPSVDTRVLSAHIRSLGSPPVSTFINLPLQSGGSGAEFGLDIGPYLDRLSGQHQAGHYLVGIRRQDGSSVRQWMRIQVTDLCLTTIEEPLAVKFAVTSLSTGKPVPGALVRVESAEPYTSDPAEWEESFVEMTDEDGSAYWPIPSDSDFRIRRISVVQDDDVLVWQPTDAPDEYSDNQWNASDHPWLQWAMDGGDGREEQRLWLAHIFTERPVYRPEEPVHIKGYIRTRYRGELTVPDISGSVVIRGPGRLEWRYPVAVTAVGSFYHQFYEDNLPTGEYRVWFEDADGQHLGQARFRKEAYRLPEFEVNLHAADITPLDREFEIKLTATYYSGGRVADRPIHWRVTQYPDAWAPKSREGFLFSSDSRFSRGDRFAASPRLDVDDATDEHGSATLALNPAVEPNVHPRIYLVEATVTGLDEQTVTAVRRISALPPFVLGLNVGRFLPHAEEVTPQLLAAGPDGELLAGVPVTVRLIHRQWHSYLRASDFTAGETRYVTDVVEETVQEIETVTADEPVEVPLPIPRAGVYIVELEARDELGRAQIVAVDLYAGGDEPVGWSKPVSDVFTVRVEKDRYDPGETAVLVLESPFQQAEVLAVTEAPDGPEYQWLSITNGAAVFRLQVLPSYVPRVPVHFILMRARLPGILPVPGTATDLGRPVTMAATSWINVNPISHRINVTIEGPDRAEPGSAVDLTIKLSTPDGSPVPGELTLWLVDAAVLALGREQPLDPVPDFVTPVTSRLRFHDTRNEPFGFLPFAELPGGDEGEEDGLIDRSSLRRNFQPVPYYAPAIMVDESGVAVITAQLPDNLTLFKIRAKAVSGSDRFGYATGEIAVRLPVIVQPALPRFVRPGDAFSAVAIARIVEGDGGEVAAQFQADGVELTGPAALTLLMEPNVPHRLEFSVTVTTPPVDARGQFAYDHVTFLTAVQRAGDGAKDGYEVQIPVRDDREPITERQVASLLPGDRLPLPAVTVPARQGTARRSALISPRLELIHMAAGLNYLFEYPHGCLEQRVSCAWTALATERFRGLLGLDTGQQKVDYMVNSLLEWLPTVIDANGLCAFWPGASGRVYLTAWTVEFLVAAKNAGYPVDENLFARLKQTLQRSLRSDFMKFIPGEEYTERTAALRALMTAGEYNGPYTAELARRSEFLNLESAARVTQVLTQAGDAASGQLEMLTARLWEGIVFRLHQGKTIYGGLNQDQQRTALILPGETRTLAELTLALHKAAPADSRVEVLIQALMTLGRSDGWGSTNANAAALLALSSLLEQAPEQPDITITVSTDGQQQVLPMTSDAPAAFWSVPSLAAVEFILPAAAAQPVAVSVATVYVPDLPGRQAEARANGFVVTREWLKFLSEDEPLERVSMDLPGATLELIAGDVVEDHVRVVNPAERTYVAIAVPLAAGLELLNPNLATAPPEARPANALTLEPSYRALLDDQIVFYYDELPAGTYDFYFRTRAIVPGAFTQPPARAELMYDLSVRGNSPGASVTIVAAAD